VISVPLLKVHDTKTLTVHKECKQSPFAFSVTIFDKLYVRWSMFICEWKPKLNFQQVMQLCLLRRLGKKKPLHSNMNFLICPFWWNGLSMEE